MERFSLTNTAKKDLHGIARFTEKRWGHKQTQYYLKGIDNTFRRLADNPLLGNTCDYIDIRIKKIHLPKPHYLLRIKNKKRDSNYKNIT